MLSPRNHALAFCSENQRLGQEIISDLSKAGYQLHQYQFGEGSEDGFFSEKILEARGQVILLITDNWLRCEECVHESLPVLEELHRKDRLIPVIADGQSWENGQVVKVPTTFHTLKDVLRYIKHWQERYLDLRQHIRKIPNPDPSLEQQLERVKSISSSIGILINFLREVKCCTIDEFRQNAFEFFFKRIGDLNAHEKLKRLLERGEVDQSNASLVDFITSASQDLMAENKELQSANTGADPSNTPKIQTAPNAEDPDKDLSVKTEELIDELEKEEEEEIAIVIDLDDEEDEEKADPLLDQLEDNPESDMDMPDFSPSDARPSADEILQVAIGLFEKGKKDQGLGFLRGALEGAPDNHVLQYYYAFALARYGQNHEAAIRQVDDLLKKNPDYAEAWFLKGELAESTTDFHTALECFTKTAELKPDFPGVYYRMGLICAFHLEEKGQQAIEHFQKAVAQDPNNADAHYCLGTLLAEKKHDYPAAISHLLSTTELKPRHPFAWYDLAVLYFKLGKRQLAHQFYQKSIEINPELKTPQNDRVFALPDNRAEANASETAEVEIEKSAAELPVTQAPSAETIERHEAMPPAPMQKETKTVLITGATAGIGKATAEIFAKNGFRVMITGRRQDRLEALSNHFKESYGAEVLALPFDVRDPQAVKAAIDNLPEEWRQVDILINNAGLSLGLDPIHEGDPENWDTMIDTNIKGLLYMTRAIAPQMVARRNGHIINVASSAGKEVYPGGNVYCATKSAVETLTKAMRLDLYKFNVRVSQVSPGHVEETEFARVRFDWDEQRAAAVYENFQPLKASDVAEAIYFIATRPPHVNIQDIYMFSTQQAGSNFIDRSGRK
ncbi:MAG: hypothetical protein KatS3mg030_449 [Saprospiraceae bacterium]|nr:MAG: hypothetical protein KatS3mg030_449 [Saprospiraceae bacterium]